MDRVELIQTVKVVGFSACVDTIVNPLPHKVVNPVTQNRHLRLLVSGEAVKRLFDFIKWVREEDGSFIPKKEWDLGQGKEEVP